MSLSTEKDLKKHPDPPPGFKRNLACISTIYLFRGLEMDCLKLLAMISRSLDYIAGDHLLSPGEDDGYAFYILSGSLQALYEKGGSRHVVNRFQESEFIGSLSLFAKMVRVFTLEATEGTTVLRLERKSVQKAFQQFPDSYAKMLANLAGKIDELDRGLLSADAFGSNRVPRVLGFSLL